jgi:hypothetical protein
LRSSPDALTPPVNRVRQKNAGAYKSNDGHN